MWKPTFKDTQENRHDVPHVSVETWMKTPSLSDCFGRLAQKGLTIQQTSFLWCVRYTSCENNGMGTAQPDTRMMSVEL